MCVNQYCRHVNGMLWYEPEMVQQVVKLCLDLNQIIPAVSNKNKFSQMYLQWAICN